MRTWGLFRQFKYVWNNQSAKNLYDDTQIDAMIDEWTDSIQTLSDKQLLKAFNFLKNTSNFLPSIAEFKRAALGIIDNEMAFNIACEIFMNYERGIKNEETGEWVKTWLEHPSDKNKIIEEVVKKIGAGNFKVLDKCDLKQTFIDYYKPAVDELLNA